MLSRLFLLIFCISLVSSTASIDYFYHPECGHCKKIQPFIQESIYNYNYIEWNLFDTSKEFYNISATPMLRFTTNDGRNIIMFGSYEIPKYLECEINEQSNLNCPTYSSLESRDVSWFIRE